MLVVQSLVPDEELASNDWEKNPPAHLWTAEGFGEGYASVAIVGGMLFTPGDVEDGQAVFTANADDGKIQWKKLLTQARPEHKHEGSRCTPFVDGDLLFVITSDGSIACLKTADGELVWQRNFSDWGGKMMSGWGFSESPLVDGNFVFASTSYKTGACLLELKKQGDSVVAEE